MELFSLRDTPLLEIHNASIHLVVDVPIGGFWGLSIMNKAAMSNHKSLPRSVKGTRGEGQAPDPLGLHPSHQTCPPCSHLR